jgi:hypothetical protein
VDGRCFVGDHHIKIRCLSKLNLEQPFLKFILYMEQNNVSIYDFFFGNWSKTIVCDATIFIAFYINDVIGDVIWWFGL